MNLLHRLAMWALKHVCRFRVAGLENVRGAGPAVFVANHCGSLGPVVIMVSLPVRFYPWIMGEMMDPARSPAYLYDDFVHPTLHLSGRAGKAVSQLVSWLVLPLFRQVGCVPVESSRGWTAGAFRKSLQLLAEAKNLLIFPEDPQQPPNPASDVRPFNHGVANLCRIYRARCGADLTIYPMVVDPASRSITIRSPIWFQADGHWRQDVRRFTDRLQEQVEQLLIR